MDWRSDDRTGYDQKVMMKPESSLRGWSWDRVLLLVLAALAGGLALASRSLIVPYPQAAAWFESAAFFPLLALGLMALAGLVEVFNRRQAMELKDSEELDSSQARMGLAWGMLVLFGLYMLAVPWLGYLSSTLLFLVVSSRVLGFAWRTTWALSLPLALAMWWVFLKLLKVHFGHGWLI
jgi:hypothetical protein